MWWSPLPRHRPTGRPAGGCTIVEADDPMLSAPDPVVSVARPWLDAWRATVLLAAHVHADGPPIGGAIAAAAVMQPLTAVRDPRRHSAWLVQGLYHRIAGAEARRLHRGEDVVRAHQVRARSVLRLAATSPDPLVRRRARTALLGLAATVT